jgi:thiosulfate dehydrogenase
MIRPLFSIALAGITLVSASLAADELSRDAEIQHYIDTLTEMGFPEPEETGLLHIPPTMQDLENAKIHPELKKLFVGVTTFSPTPNNYVAKTFLTI